MTCISATTHFLFHASIPLWSSAAFFKVCLIKVQRYWPEVAMLCFAKCMKPSDWTINNQSVCLHQLFTKLKQALTFMSLCTMLFPRTDGKHVFLSYLHQLPLALRRFWSINSLASENISEWRRKKNIMRHNRTSQQSFGARLNHTTKLMPKVYYGTCNPSNSLCVMPQCKITYSD